LYLFVGVMKMVSLERYKAIRDTQKWYLQLGFGLALLASFAAGTMLINRVAPTIWGPP
jgi:hypothetical protein